MGNKFSLLSVGPGCHDANDATNRFHGQPEPHICECRLQLPVETIIRILSSSSRPGVACQEKS